jgi:4-aminobutyrate aminotransferase/(S)-3-amino-2-methylpropionate transaminase
MEPDADMTNKVAKMCHQNGVLVLTAGTYGNVLRFLPPMVMSENLLEDALTIIEQQFKEATA